MRHFVFLIAIFASLIPGLRAAEPFFKPNDVVALVGGEDMVVAAELGYLETLIQLALPDHHLKFRSLAREGDTVFEQRRDLNYPKLEDQLDKIGATVVICQFGQMESLAGKEKVGEFVAAYEKLIGRLKGKDGARRVCVLNIPVGTEPTDLKTSNPTVSHNQLSARSYHLKIIEMATNATLPHISRPALSGGYSTILYVRDGIHRAEPTHEHDAYSFFEQLPIAPIHIAQRLNTVSEGSHQLRQLIAAKNRLWFHYYRPQNWAFLAGDRTNQPSSRDHLDPSKRWFPEELEKFVPLIDAKDAEIWALAKKLSAGGKN